MYHVSCTTEKVDVDNICFVAELVRCSVVCKVICVWFARATERRVGYCTTIGS